MSGQTIKIIASVIVIGGAATYLLADTLMADPDALTYFHTADEVLVNPDQFKGQKIRVGGYVQKGSILQKPGTLEYQFEVMPIDKPGMLKHPEVKDQTITVRYTGIVPDTFKDDAEVIVAGNLVPAGDMFVAQELVAKCPSKYEAEEKSAGTY